MYSFNIHAYNNLLNLVNLWLKWVKYIKFGNPLLIFQADWKSRKQRFCESELEFNSDLWQISTILWRGVSENRDNMAAGPVSERNQGRLDPWLRVDAAVVSWL